MKPENQESRWARLMERLRILSRKNYLKAEQFEREYAERSGTSVEKLREHLTVRPCDCDAEECEGWEMVSHEQAAEIDDPEKPWAR